MSQATNELPINGSEKNPEELVAKLVELDPRPVDYFMPDNLEIVMTDFLNGDTKSIERATYPALDALDFSQISRLYTELLLEITSNPSIPLEHHRTYERYITNKLKINDLMSHAVAYRKATTPEARKEENEKFSVLNQELYGAPDISTATSMAKEVLNDITGAPEPKIVKLAAELKDLLPDVIKDKLTDAEPLSRPSEEAKDLVKRMTSVLYDSLIKRADELIALMASEENKPQGDLKFSPQAVAVIFQSIIDSEFPDSGWKVVIGPASAIKVTASTKTVTVKENRVPVNPDKLKGLVVHELGVHMLRSIIGEGADLIPLRFGLEDIDDAEEGMAKVMESSIAGDNSRTGYQHYLTAALLNSGYNFADAFEVMWRYKALDAYLDKPTSKIDDKFIDRQKKGTFKFMFRSIRGTNELPWHLTLSYFNGTHKIWEYIESHKDDPDLVTLMFMGKIDPTNSAHLKSALGAKAKV